MNPTGHSRFNLALRTPAWARVLAVLVAVLLVAGAISARPAERAAAQSPDGGTGAAAQAEKAPEQAAEKAAAPSEPAAQPLKSESAAAPSSADSAEAMAAKSGGPDAFGYTFDDNEVHPAHGVQFQDISGTGTPLVQGGADVAGLAGGGLDDGYWDVPFPVPFKFYGTDRNGQTLSISTNGFASFSSANAAANTNSTIPSNADPNDAVFPFWDDLNPDAVAAGIDCGTDIDCGIYTQTVGAAPNRRFIIQWNEMAFFGGNPDEGYVTFQVQFVENSGEIRFEYQDPEGCTATDCVRGFGDSATIGIESADPANAFTAFTGLQYSFNDAALQGKAGNVIPSIVFHPPNLEVKKTCFSPETELENAPASGTAEVVLAGQQWICRIEVINHGAAPIANVVVQDAIPARTRLVYSGRPSTPAVPVAGPANVTFDVGIVPGNDSVFWEIGFIVEPDYLIQGNPPYPEEDEICNEAMIVNPMTLTYSPSREVDRDCDVVKDRADLKITKLVEPFSGIRAGDTFTYTIYVDNLGPSASRNVVISDTLLSSGRVSVQSCAFSVSQGGGAITQFTCTTGNLVSTQFGTDVGTFRTNFLEPLTPTSQGRLRASFRLVAQQAIDTTNTARVTALTPDQDLSNNMAMVNLSVSSVSDVFINKDDAAANPDAGETFTYTIDVGNNGPSRAENVVVTDVLPLDVDIVSITPSVVGPPVPGSTPTAGNCATTQSAAGNEVVTCNFGTLSSVIASPGTIQRRITIVVRVKDNVPGGTTLFNEARVSSDEYDDNNSNNISVEDTPVGQLSQFALLKLCTPDPVVAGGVLHCAYSMTNTGPSTANNVIFTDSWLTGGEFVKLISANSQGHPGDNTCYQEDNFGQTQVRCSFGDVPVGRTIRLDLEFAVDPSTPQGTVLSNCFLLGADSPIVLLPPVITRCQLTTVRGVSDVLITKVASDPSPVAGTDYSYKYTVKNNGPSTAFDVTVTDTLPDGLTFVSVNDARCSESGGQVTCNFGDMLPGAMIMFEVFVRLDADYDCGDTLQNNVRVRWDADDDGELDSESVSVSEVLVDCVSDLKVTKVGKPDNVVYEDDLLIYTIVVDNLGPSVAEDVSIKDLIAASGQFDVEAVSSDRDAECRSNPAPIGGNPFDPTDDLADGRGETGNLTNLYQLDCTLDDDLEVLTADGFPNPGRWIVQIAVDGDEPGSINNIVSTLSESLDPDQSNNMAMTEHEVVSLANLSIQKTDLPDCDPSEDWPGNFCDMMGNGDTVAIAGTTDDPGDPDGDSTFHYRLTVQNDGPGDAHNVVVTDNLPKEVEVTRITKQPDTGSCTTVQGTDFQQVVTCNLGTLADEGEARIDIYVRVPADVADGTILWNEAWVSSDATEPNNEDNRTRTRTDVIAVADLNITKEDDPDPAFVAGGAGSYTLVVTNNGPSVARNVSVEDPLPTGIDATSVDVVGVTDEVCSISPLPGSGTGREIVRCQLGDLDPGASRTIVIQFTVDEDLVPADDANQCVSTRNIASVTSDTKDPDTDDNSAIADQDVCATADLKITKTSEPEKVNAGEQKKYTITVENLGPSDATGVTVHDVLPDEASYEVDTNPAMCTQPANLVGFRAVLNTANEIPNPAGPDTATGLATFVLDTTTNVLEYAIFVNDMTSAITAAHIHTGAAGVNGPVLVNLFTGAPPVFDESHPRVGKLTLPPADAAAILGNPAGFYVNVHTSANPAGEIRGQMAQTLNSPLECEIGTLAAGSSHSFDIWALIDPNTMSGTSIINTALVFADNPPDNILYNNAAQAKNLVLAKSDLRVVKFGKPDAAVRAGDILTYTIIVDNLGPSAAKGVALKDVLRASGYFDVVNLDSDRDLTCASNPNPISGIGTIDDPLIPNNANDVEIDCTLDTPLGVLDVGDFPNPGRWIITLRVKADETQSINNVADVVSDSLDPDMTNNHAIVEHEVTDIADVALDKVGPMMVTAGGEIVYTLTVVNNGPSTAENVVVYDRLPPGIVVTDVTAEGGTCTTGTAGSPIDKLTCNLGLLGVGEDRLITITATVDAGLATGVILENDACVLSDHFDDDNSNNCDFALTTVKSVADLAVTKISDRDDDGDATDDNEDAAVAGEPIEYTITVVNNGISDAANVLLVDTLPLGTTFLSANVTVGAGSCVGLPTGEVKCQLGVIEAGATVEVVIRAMVNANYDCDDLPFLTNTVEVSSPSETDPVTLPDNTFSLVTPVECRADLLIQKWSDPVKVYAGEQKRYTVKVTNLGSSDANEVVIVDTLPVEVDYEINTGLCSVVLGEPDVVTCNVGTLPPGGMFQFDIYAKVDPDTAPGTTIQNCALVSSATADPNLDNNEACSQNLVLQKADLHVRKFGKPDGSVRAGDVLTYTVITDNLGPSWADGVALKDVLQSSGTFDLIDIVSDREASCRILPQGILPIDANLSADAWPPDEPAPPAFDVNPNTGVPNIANRLEVDCTLAEPLEVLAADGPPNSGRWILTMRVRARQTQDINNVASVVSDAFDPDPSNNNAFVEHDIIDIADLSVEKTGPAMVVAGTPITYEITVTNNGPSDAENVVLLDRLPPGITVTDASVDDGVSQCATGAAGNAADKLTCGLGLLRPGQSKVVTVNANVHADVSEGAKLENDVYVYSENFDDDNSNNWDYLITMVGTEADLEIQKFGNPNPVKAGDITSFDITYRNNGPSVARDVIVTDVLPQEFELLSADVVDGSPVSDSATCHLRKGDPALVDSVQCELGDIAPGQGGQIVVTVRVKSDTPAGEYCNTVAISSDTTDPDEANNTAMWCLTISPMADLLIEKWSDPVKVAAGEQKRYTVKVTNLGPSDAVNVIVTDTLPKEVDYEIDTGLCEVKRDSGPDGEDVVTCEFGTMKPGAMKSVDIYALVRPGTQPGDFITNCADVTSDTPDGINELNNRACSENFILQKADLKVTKFGKRDGAVRAADILTYTVIVDNLGPSWADNAAIKDVLQTSGKFELLSLHSDRAATCNILKAGTVPTTVNLAAEPWPVNGPLPALPAVGDINQRVEVDCELDADLEVIEPDGPPNSGRWILTMRVRARQAQSVNNVATVTNVVPIEGDQYQGNLASDPDPSNNMAMVEHEITDVADLRITKTALGENVTGCLNNNSVIGNVANQVTAGLSLKYTLVATNFGPSTAENVVVYDRLPPGVVLTGGTITDHTGVPSAGKFSNWCNTGTPGSPLDKLVCGVGTLEPVTDPAGIVIPPKARVTIEFTVKVDPGLAKNTVLENDAYVASDVFDPENKNWANNLTTVNTSADLSIDKTDTPDPVVAGELLRYQLMVTNDGPSVARDVTIYDTLPATVKYQFAIGATCTQDPVNPRAIQCSLGDMAVGDMRFVYLIVKVDPDSPSPISNTASVQSGNTDWVPTLAGKITNDPCIGDNTDTEPTTVIRRVDPFIMKTDLTDPVIAGKQATYLVMFGNNGPSTATNISITDLLPDGFTLNRCDPLDPNDAPVCTGQGTRNVTLTQIRNKNSVLWNSNTADLLNRLDPGESYSFLIVADVSPGYVLDGLSDAWGNKLAVPAGTQGGVCESYGRASDYLHWAANRATLTQSPPPLNETDINLNNNFDDECTRVNAEADLKVVKTDIFSGGTANAGNAFLQCDPVQPGGMITYDLTITNMGMSDAAPVVVTDWLPQEFVVLDPAQVSVSVTGGLGQVLEVRDDGRIRILVGRDSARAFALPTLGRLNNMNSVTVRIQVMVVNPWASMDDKRFVNPMPPFNRICGAVLLNTATVSTASGFYAPLRDLFEVPPVVGSARGAGVFVVDPDTNNMFFWFGVVNTTGTINGVRLHRASAAPFAYNNGNVVYTLYTTAPPVFGPGTPLSGTIQITQADVADMLANKFYANITTTSFPNGQLRGQLLPGTLDPVLANNTDTETTTIECPAIKVRKTVSYDGTCPGASVPTVARSNAMVTFCIEVTNVGTTWLDNIQIVDRMQTSMGVQEFKRTITHGKDPKLPVAPGETVLETIMVPPLTDMCGTVTNTVTVTGTPVNSGRTIYPCLSPVTHSDSINIFVPCGGADYRLQLPALNTDECDTWLQVQNVGSLPTVGIVVVWGEAGACPPQAAGPLKIECTGILKPGSAWTYTTDNLPAGTRSAIVYSVNATDMVTDDRGNQVLFSDLACDRLFNYIVGNHGEWNLFDTAYQSQGRYVLPPQFPNPQGIVFDFGKHQGQPIAVTVNRTCPDPVDPNRNVSAAYVGIGTYLEGAMDPVFGDFSYYAPLVFANKGGLNSWIWIHNSGLRCSSIEIWFKAQDNCMRPILGDVLAVAPGESAHFDPNTVVGPDWIGSAWIRASQPLGIVVDTMGPNHFTSYHGVPSDSYDDKKETTFSIGSQVNYAPLIYSEYQGWDAAIQVQNLSGTTAAKVKVYFLDRSGDVITTIVDWICPRGSQTFFLPVIAGMPGNWVGSARVESQEWWTPGTKPIDPPRIQSVVLLEKWSDPARSERREAVAYNALTEQVAYDWQIGKLQGGTMSGSAVLAVPLVAKGNRGITTELAITNLVAKPGFTDFAIFLYDQNGLLDFYCQKLHSRQVDYIDLATQGWVPQRFLGSAVVSATFWEHDVFSPTGNFVRNLVGLGGVVVERIGGTQGGPDVPGDESKAFEMIPIFDYFTPQRVPTCTGQPPFNP